MTNRVTEILRIKYPVVQAPMLWNTSAELVAAVSEAGGIGTLGPLAGSTSRPSGPEEAAKMFRDQISKVRSMTSKPFAVNWLLSEHFGQYSEPLLDVILTEKVPVVAIAGVDVCMEKYSSVVEKLHAVGTVVIYRDTTPTIASALAAEKAGVDIYVVTGYEAAGHVPTHEIGLSVILTEITGALTIPVLAAGGIWGSPSASLARGGGAEGVYAGTRFLASIESPTSTAAKEAIVNAKAEDAKVVSVNNHLSRCILPASGPSWITKEGDPYKVSLLDGDLTYGLLSVSQAVGLINSIDPAAKIVSDLGRPFVCL